MNRGDTARFSIYAEISPLSRSDRRLRPRSDLNDGSDVRRSYDQHPGPGGTQLSGAAEPALLREERVRLALQQASHVLPVQGPIGVFVHHNTLHAFEALPFEEAVLEAADLFGAEPYMAEARYRQEIARGRIAAQDIDAVIEGEPEYAVFPRMS